jgi:hypothetical protein
MITTVLKKIESGWVRLDWSDYIDRLNLSQSDLETIVDLINNFKRNRKAKDIVICKYRYLPAYVCVEKGDFVRLLDWICSESIRREWYETCQRIMVIKKEMGYEQV